MLQCLAVVRNAFPSPCTPAPAGCSCTAHLEALLPHQPHPIQPLRFSPLPSPSPQPVEVPFLQYYGASTKAAYDGITSLDELSNSLTGNAPAPSSSGGSSGVSSGAAAGIGIGCAVAGALLGVLGMALFAKKKAGWQRHGDVLTTGGAGSDGYKL